VIAAPLGDEGELFGQAAFRQAAFLELLSAAAGIGIVAADMRFVAHDRALGRRRLVEFVGLVFELVVVEFVFFAFHEALAYDFASHEQIAAGSSGSRGALPEQCAQLRDIAAGNAGRKLTSIGKTR
jgi:hypothetical protein